MVINVWEALGKTALITLASLVLHLGLGDAIFVMISTDVIQAIVMRWIDG